MPAIADFVVDRMSYYTAEEKELSLKMLEYERAYFEDMTFQPGSITGDIFAKHERDVLVRRKNKEYLKFPEDDPPPDISIFPCKIEKLKGAEGIFRGLDGIIIDPKHNNRNVILHEMIHAYEFIFENFFTEYSLRDVLFARLYGKLSGIIQNLDKLVMQFAHYNRETLVKEKNEHTVLFYLKCLDLEYRTLRDGNTFGTISDFYMRGEAR
jgi:hypothetical protein